MQQSNKTTTNSKNTAVQLFVKDEAMINALKKKGIKHLLPVQEQTFNFICEGEDVIAKDRTGSGKTIAYALPTMLRLKKQLSKNVQHYPKFLILLPTRELALQVTDQIQSLQNEKEKHLVTVPIYGGISIHEHIRQISYGADIVVATPGRLIDMLDRRKIDLSGLRSICLDEADEMLNIGFKQSIQKIFIYIRKCNKNKPQVLMFSATLPDWIWKMSQMYQRQSVKYIDMIKQQKIKTSKTVDHWCIQLQQSQKRRYINAIMNAFFKGERGKTIIFCQTKRQVQEIGRSGILQVKSVMLHGDFQQYMRENVFRQFKSGKADCLIATNVAARGLDFPAIDLIIQLQPPTKTDQYIHRSGRTGRVGRQGCCVTIYSSREIYLMQRIQSEAQVKFAHIQKSDLIPQSSQKNYNSYNDWREQVPKQHQQQNQKANYMDVYDNNRNYQSKRY